MPCLVGPHDRAAKPRDAFEEVPDQLALLVLQLDERRQVELADDLQADPIGRDHFLRDLLDVLVVEVAGLGIDA